MADPLHSDETVREARTAGDPQRVADALAAHADALVRQARWKEATAALDESAALHGGLGHAERQAQCLRLAAALSRFAGDFDGAQRRARSALDCVAATTAVAAEAWVEWAEAAMARGDAAGAEQAWGHALAAAASANQPPAVRALLHRRRAALRAHAGSHTEALEDLVAARTLLESAGDAAGARRVRIEHASALHAAGRRDESARNVQELIADASAWQDAAVLADAWLLRAARAFEDRDPAAARDAAVQAREAALRAVAAPAYLAAARALAQAHEALGERVEAYRALASAWATLADLLGPDTGRAWVEPLLAALAQRWGRDAFAQVRAEHDRQRREALAGAAGTRG